MTTILLSLSLAGFGQDTTKVTIRCSDTTNHTLSIPFWTDGYEVIKPTHDPYLWLWPKNTVQVIYLDLNKEPLKYKVWYIKNNCIKETIKLDINK